MNNVILITIDCLRADHLSCMGYGRRTSPFIDSLAEKGMLFSQAIINGVLTCASFPALMTSTYPFMYGGYERINRKTVAEALRERGYVTAGFNDNGFLSPYFGYDKGFDHFSCMSLKKGKTLNRRIVEMGEKTVGKNKHISNFVTRLVYHSRLLGNWSMNGETVNRAALSWLRENYAANFFLWVHYMDVHGPHYAPKEYFEKIDVQCPSGRELSSLNNKLRSGPSKLYKNGQISERAIEILKVAYDAEIRYVDDCIKDIFDGLVSLGIDKNTAMIITSDHGEEFFEHGNYHSAEDFHDEILRVPLIIYGAGIPCSRVDTQVQQIDIAPTILDLLGEVGEGGFMGKSLLLDNAGSEYVIAEVALNSISGSGGQKIINIDFNLRKTAIRLEKGHNKWKYIHCTRENKEELYDLANDPFEKNNLVGKKGPEAEKLLGEFRERLKTHFNMEEEQRRIKQRLRRVR